MSDSQSPSIQDTNGSILSQSTILILSGYLVGIAAGQTTSVAMQFSLHAAGMTGFVAYISLSYLARQRQALRNEKNRIATRAFELRFDRYVSQFRPCEKQPSRRNHRDDYRQYLTVTTANRPVRREKSAFSSR